MQRTGWLAAGVAYAMAGIARGEPKDTIYDEAKVPAYTLPDPLVTQDGTRITDADSWRNKRRPEVLADVLRRHRSDEIERQDARQITNRCPRPH